LGAKAKGGKSFNLKGERVAGYNLAQGGGRVGFPGAVVPEERKGEGLTRLEGKELSGRRKFFGCY